MMNCCWWCRGGCAPQDVRGGAGGGGGGEVGFKNRIWPLATLILHGHVQWLRAAAVALAFA